jgi:hypothetical protein
MKSDSACTDDRAAISFDAYINGTIAAEDLAGLQAHVKECLACAARIANAKTIQAAATYYGCPVRPAGCDDADCIELLGLIVVNLTGEPLIRKYGRNLDCRQNTGKSSHE